MDSMLPDPSELQREKLVSQSKDLGDQQARANTDAALAARLESYRMEQRSIAEARKTPPEGAKSQPQGEDENDPSRQKKNAEPIRDASVRYAQAFGMHYNILDPYASLARSAMAEHAAFRSDRENLDKKIAQASDPAVRQALEIRKEIELADYTVLTSERIARQSYVITGNKATGSEFDKFNKQAAYYREHATELRKQWRDLTQPEQERSQTASGPTTQPAPARDNRGPNSYAELKERQNTASPSSPPAEPAPGRDNRGPNRYAKLNEPQKTTAPAEDQDTERQRTQEPQNQPKRPRGLHR
jgi:hypothetical protein